MERSKLLFICLIVFAFYAHKRCQSAEVNICGRKDYLPCDNSQCILRENWCDGDIDCSDGSDESYCEERGWWQRPDHRCTDKHFECDDARCFPATVRCDSIKDCLDYSDEYGCEETSDGSLDRFTPPPTPENAVGVGYGNTNDSISTYDSHTGRPSRYTNTPISTTTTRRTTAYTPPSRFPSTTDYYGRKVEETSDPNRQGPYPNRNGQYPHNYYHPNNYNQRTERPRQNNRGSDTAPGQNYPYGPQHTDYSTSPPPPYRPTRAFTTTPSSFRTGYNLPRESRNSYVHRQSPVFIPPRSVLHPPGPRQLFHGRNKTSNVVLPPFYFSHNYTEELGYKYQRNIQKAVKWLIDRRDSTYGWGDNTDTPRALVALSLVTNSFVADVGENDLMKKSLQTHLGIKLISFRSKREEPTVPRLALYINALLATCQNPRDFLGIDLVQHLNQRRYGLNHQQRISTVYPLVFLTLCLSNHFFQLRDIQNLHPLLFPRDSDEVAKDRQSLAISAMACILQQGHHHTSEIRSELHHLKRSLDDSAHKLMTHQQLDGGFGNLYSTALAAQALMSVNSTTWNPTEALDYLVREQSDDGSFGDMLSTYYSVIALSGRSLLHIRNTRCDFRDMPDDQTLTPQEILSRPGPRKNVLISIAMGYPGRPYSIQLNVPEDTNLLDIMRVAEFDNRRFRFKHKESNVGTEIYAIGDVPNDPERKLYWNLYELNPTDQLDVRRRNTQDIKQIIPRDSQEFRFWYLPIE